MDPEIFDGSEILKALVHSAPMAGVVLFALNVWFSKMKSDRKEMNDTLKLIQEEISSIKLMMAESGVGELRKHLESDNEFHSKTQADIRQLYTLVEAKHRRPS